MRNEYDISKLNPRKNLYVKADKKAITDIKNRRGKINVQNTFNPLG